MANGFLPPEELARLKAALAVIDSFVSGDSGPTVRELWESYAKVGAKELRDWGTEVGRSRPVLAAFGERRAASLTFEDVDTYRDDRTEFTSPATRNREVALLRKLCYFGVKRKKLAANPLAGVAMEAENNVRRTVYTDEQIHRMLARSQPVLGVCIIGGYDMGMRRDEVRLLRWDSIEGDIITLYPGEDTKNGVGRAVPMSARFRDAVSALPRCSPFVCANPDTGKPYDHTSIHDWFNAVIAACGITGKNGEVPRLHDCRRSFATHAREAGIPESVIMELMGHKTHAMFDRYNIIDPGELRSTIAKLDDLRAQPRRPPQAARAPEFEALAAMRHKTAPR